MPRPPSSHPCAASNPTPRTPNYACTHVPYLAAIPLVFVAAALGLLLTLWGLFEHRRNLRAAATSDGPPAESPDGFADTLRAVPLKLLIGLDLLDLGLDVLAAPVVWLLLDRAGLKSLRTVASLEALVPFTQPIPLLTLSWAFVRISDSLRGIRARPAPRPGVDSAAAAQRPPRKRVLNEAQH